VSFRDSGRLCLARAHVPALILLDVMLPKMSGPDVLKALKKDPETAVIPVMMLTSLSQKNAKQFEKDGASVSSRSPMPCWGKVLTRCLLWSTECWKNELARGTSRKHPNRLLYNRL
jgi:CheY-like chemotaxis protein